MSNFNTLADRFSAAKAVADAANAAVDALKKEFKLLGVEQIEGFSCYLNLGLSERTTLDSKAVAKLLTAEQIASVSKVTLVETVRVKAKASDALIAAALAEIAA